MLQKNSDHLPSLNIYELIYNITFLQNSFFRISPVITFEGFDIRRRKIYPCGKKQYLKSLHYHCFSFFPSHIISLHISTQFTSTLTDVIPLTLHETYCYYHNHCYYYFILIDTESLYLSVTIYDNIVSKNWWKYWALVTQRKSFFVFTPLSSRISGEPNNPDSLNTFIVYIRINFWPKLQINDRNLWDYISSAFICPTGIYYLVTTINKWIWPKCFKHDQCPSRPYLIVVGSLRTILKCNVLSMRKCKTSHGCVDR